MEKQECKKLNGLFDEVEFIENLEQYVRNARNGVKMMVNPVCFDFKPVVFPKGLTEFVLNALTTYKETLIETLDNLKIVDTTDEPEIDPEPDPEPTPDPEPEPGEGENPTE